MNLHIRTFVLSAGFIYHSAVGRERAIHKSTTMEQPVWNFEQEYEGESGDETSVNLRAYFDRMPNDKMQQYSSEWTDDQVVEWDDNFRDDGNLMLLCCEREVDVEEYRQVLHECIKYRDRKNSHG